MPRKLVTDDVVAGGNENSIKRYLGKKETIPMMNLDIFNVRCSLFRRFN